MNESNLIRAMGMFAEALEWLMWGIAAQMEDSPARVAESAQNLAIISAKLQDLANVAEGRS